MVCHYRSVSTLSSVGTAIEFRMTFTMTDTHFIINVFNNERIQEEQNELVAAHNEMLEFIMRSAKQMEAFILK